MSARTREGARVAATLSQAGWSAHIARVLGAWCEPPTVYQGGYVVIAMDLYDGNLDNYLESIRWRSEDISAGHICAIALQILQGVASCHAAGVVHRNIKTQNGSSRWRCRLKLVLYGHDPSSSYHSVGDTRFVLSGFSFSREDGIEGISAEKHGTSGYRAPELLASGQYSAKTDIWAFGCILVEIATTGRGLAFRGDFDVMRYATDPNIDFAMATTAVNTTLTDEQKDGLDRIIGWTLRRNPDERPSGEELYQEICSWGKIGSQYVVSSQPSSADHTYP